MAKINGALHIYICFQGKPFSPSSRVTANPPTKDCIDRDCARQFLDYESMNNNSKYIRAWKLVLVSPCWRTESYADKANSSLTNFAALV